MKKIHVKTNSLLSIGLFIFLFSCQADFMQDEFAQKINLVQKNIQTQENSQWRFISIQNLFNQVLIRKNISLLGMNKIIQSLLYLIAQYPHDQYLSYYYFKLAQSYEYTQQESVAVYYYQKIVEELDNLYFDFSNDLSIDEGKDIYFYAYQGIIKYTTDNYIKIRALIYLLKNYPTQINLENSYKQLAYAYRAINASDKALENFTRYINFKKKQSSIDNSEDLKILRYIELNASNKNWTVYDVNQLMTIIKKSVLNADMSTLNRYRSKVNFFILSWDHFYRQDAISRLPSRSQRSFNSFLRFYIRQMRLYRRSIVFLEKIESLSNRDTIYLKSYGWQSVGNNTWIFVFKKIDYPFDAQINQSWEWAGIYLGDILS